MNPEPFGNKHQPKTLDEFIGNVEVRRSLKAVLSNPHRYHGYVISGGYGLGKTSLAQAVGRYIGADELLDITDVSVATCKDLKAMRKLFGRFKYMPHGNARVFIFNEAHTIIKSAQEELLHYLDNPPRLTFWVFCTATPEKLIEPLRDRCFSVTLQPLNRKKRVKLVSRVCGREGVVLPEKVVGKIVDESGGVPRKLLNLLFSAIMIHKAGAKKRRFGNVA
jgi:DNA polymerase III gamma/tau subunit